MIKAPSVMRSKSRPVAIMITKTADNVSGIAAATTMPTRKPSDIRLTTITTVKRGEELRHELVDRLGNDPRLVRHLGEGHAESGSMVLSSAFSAERLAEPEAVEARLHDHAENERAFALVADREARRIDIAAMHLGYVADLQGAAAGVDRDVLDRVDVVDRAVEPEVDPRPVGLDEAGRASRRSGCSRRRTGSVR